MYYAASLRYLNSFLNLERIVLHPDNRLFNLERMKFLLRISGRPEKNFFPILIAGTKGKGSTGFFLESILAAAGIHVGFYSSPHLEDPRERIRLQGKTISKASWTKGVRKIQVLLRRMKPPIKIGDFTYFEILTLLSIQLFKEGGVEIGLFEVGMGGRLDATNVLDAKIAILTPIHLDHEAFLGNTISKIAREKAAIIRPHANVIVGPQKQEAMREIKQRVKRQKAILGTSQELPLTLPSPLTGERGGVREAKIKLGLAGDFQRINAGAAVSAAEVLRDRFGFPIPESAIRRGLACTNWPGRMEVIEKGTGPLKRGQGPVPFSAEKYLLDGAHNPASIEALVRNLERLYGKAKRLLIFGTSRDKKSEIMLKTLSSFFDDVILTPTPNPRSQEISTLLLQARGKFRRIFPVGSVRAALKLAQQLSDRRTLLVLTGSFYLIGEARRILRCR